MATSKKLERLRNRLRRTKELGNDPRAKEMLEVAKSALVGSVLSRLGPGGIIELVEALRMDGFRRGIEYAIEVCDSAEGRLRPGGACAEFLRAELEEIPPPDFIGEIGERFAFELCPYCRQRKPCKCRPAS